MSLRYDILALACPRNGKVTPLIKDVFDALLTKVIVMSLCYIQRAKRNIFILLLLYATRNILDVSCFENISTTVVAALLLKYSMQSIVVLADTDRDAILPNT